MTDEEIVAVAQRIMAGGDRPERSDEFTAQDDRWVNFCLEMLEDHSWTIDDREEYSRASALCDLLGGFADLRADPDPWHPNKTLPGLTITFRRYDEA